MGAIRHLVLLVSTAGIVHFGGCTAVPAAGEDSVGIFFQEEIDRLPGLQMDATVIPRDGELQILARAAVPSTGLSFVERENGYEAILEVRFSIIDARGRESIAAASVRDTIRVSTFAETRTHFLATSQSVLPTETGSSSIVEVAVIDLDGSVVGRQRQAVLVDTPEAGPFLTSPILFRGNEPLIGSKISAWGFEPPARVEVEVIGSAEEPEISLLRYSTDSDVANPPHWTSPGRGSLSYLGVRLDQSAEDSISVARLPDGWLLPPVEGGAHRIVAAAPDAPEAKERLLLVLPEDHPRVETLDGLIDALAYLAYPSEIEHIRAGVTQGERRRRFDAFWGGLLEDRRLAESVMRRYYERVEEANERYSSHKPGWMTDRGMIFIVIGRPEVVERTPETETWHYAFGQPDQTRTFVFDRVPYPGAGDGNHHHVLRRAARYEIVWHDAVRNLRQGTVAY